ncbi:hypothetical protein AVEN_12333-1 [Araneus ventricosus]|uniref:Uncharacterized protein n=1 Tax=Araneus ventricosus TaxID=182803 RepID=A0A4Y2L021_ARAVE|nr:hypothetical protein AVEN_12333-1 [Araneus ventricosus]
MEFVEHGKEKASLPKWNLWNTGRKRHLFQNGICGTREGKRISSKMEFVEHGKEKASLPKWNLWNTGRKKQSTVLKTAGNWHSGMAMLEFRRTQNPTLHAPIPVLGLD